MNKTTSIPSPSLQSQPALVRLGCLLLLGGVLAGCSSVSTHEDKAPIKARTFSFLNAGSKPVPNYADARKEAHAMVQQAITSNLAAKGVSYVESGGNVTVAYLIVVGDNAVTTSLNEYFGYTADSEAIVNKVHAEQTGSEERAYVQAGTLVIDFIDPVSSKLLQRRSIQARLLRDLPQEKRMARLQAIVDEALKNLPVSP